MLSFLNSVSVDAALGGLTTLAAAGLATWGILYQIARQGELNRASIADSEKRRLKSEFWNETEEKVAKLTEASSRFAAALLTSSSQVEIAARLHEAGNHYPPPTTRIMDLAALHTDYSNALIDLIQLIERRQFISSDILVFRTALNAASHPIREKFTRDFFTLGMPMLPVDLPNGSGTYPYSPPTTEDAAQLKGIAFSIQENLADIGAYVSDLLVEMQNYLLTDLFETNVPTRVPIDQRKKVISLADAPELEEYFLNKTEWGRSVKEIEAAAKTEAQKNDSLPDKTA